jgi:guanine deaminase
VTLFHGTILDTPDNPFTGGVLRAEADAGLLVRDGAIVARGPFADVQAGHANDEVIDLTAGIVLPGLIDTHVHFPQVRAIGGLGMPLLEWLQHFALPEEARLSDRAYAESIATEFINGLVEAGTTTALVFGSHFAAAVDALFDEAARTGLRITSGLVLSDRFVPDELLTTPQRAYEEGRVLAEKWHGVGRNRYAVTPRFALSCAEELLDSCQSLLADVSGSWFTSHLNENGEEIETVASLFDVMHYLDAYDRHSLVGRRSILAHNVHPTDEELKLLATRDATIAHCPTSNAAR